MRLGFLGTGTIASAAATSAAIDGFEITVSERSRARSAALAARFGTVAVAPNQDVVDRSDLVFIGVTAEQAPAALSELRFRADQSVVSFMADAPLARVAALVAPARAEAICIPFPFIAEGGSPLLVYPRAEALERVFGARHTLIALGSEADLGKYLAVQAVLSPVVKMLADAAERLGQATGDAAQAERFLRQLVGGALLARPIEADGVLADMLQALNTPGGYNATLREFLAERGVYDALQDGFAALEKRSG